MCNLQWWLCDRIGLKCTNRGDCLRHGIQNDWFSCGVILSNTIAHNVFNDDIWIPRNAVLDRVNWFLKFAKRDKEPKRTSDIINCCRKTEVRPHLNVLKHQTKMVPQALEKVTQVQDPQALDLKPNTKLMLSVAHDDHNFPDIPEARQRTVVESIVRSHLHLADLLNPSCGSESEDDVLADQSFVDEVEVDPEQAAPSEIEAGTAMLVDNHSLSQSMNVDTAYGVPSHENLGEDCPNQVDIRMSTECEAPTRESGISSIHTHDSIEDSKTNPQKKKSRQASLISFFHSSTNSTSKKRHAPSLNDSDSATSGADDGTSWKRLRSEGNSRSATASQMLRERFRAGKLEVDEIQLDTWQTKILAEDPNAEFDEKQVFSACHSKCRVFIKAKEPYDATRFRTHIKKCNDKSKKKRPAAGMPSLLKMGWNKGKAITVGRKRNVTASLGRHIPAPVSQN